MPFPSYRHFDAATLICMSTAYDEVTARLGISPDSPLTSILAVKIADLAAHGERDPAALRDKAIEYLRPKA